MGTPHSGSYLVTWEYTLARLLDRFWRINKLLKQRSEVLKVVEEIFQRQLTTSGELSHVKVFCFYEIVAMDVVGFVVPEESATMLPHANCGIDANYMDMTKSKPTSRQRSHTLRDAVQRTVMPTITPPQSAEICRYPFRPWMERLDRVHHAVMLIESTAPIPRPSRSEL